MSAPVSTIQFSHPIRRRKCLDARSPLAITQALSPPHTANLKENYHNTSLQFRNKTIRSSSKEHSINQ